MMPVLKCINMIRGFAKNQVVNLTSGKFPRTKVDKMKKIAFYSTQ